MKYVLFVFVFCFVIFVGPRFWEPVMGCPLFGIIKLYSKGLGDNHPIYRKSWGYGRDPMASSIRAVIQYHLYVELGTVGIWSEMAELIQPLPTQGVLNQLQVRSRHPKGTSSLQGGLPS